MSFYFWTLSMQLSTRILAVLAKHFLNKKCMPADVSSLSMQLSQLSACNLAVLASRKSQASTYPAQALVPGMPLHNLCHRCMSLRRLSRRHGRKLWRRGAHPHGEAWGEPQCISEGGFQHSLRGFLASTLSETALLARFEGVSACAVTPAHF
eukprot:1159834-Pelagomonas_calceolata.AAC.8